LNEAQIIDTKKADRYHLEGCKHTNVDSSQGGGKDIITSSDMFLMGAPPIKSEFNSAKLNVGDILNGYTAGTDHSERF
jgi:hypothetical protein